MLLQVDERSVIYIFAFLFFFVLMPIFVPLYISGTIMLLLGGFVFFTTIRRWLFAWRGIRGGRTIYDWGWLPESEIDEVVEAYPELCTNCGNAELKPAGEPAYRYQIKDKDGHVIEHLIYAQTCKKCAFSSEGDLPERVQKAMRYGHPDPPKQH